MKSIRSIPLLFSLCIALLVGFTACDSTNSGATGSMEVKMKDAPANFDAVTVTVTKVRVNKDQDAEGDAEETDEEAEEDGWVTIVDEPMEINLLELTNGNEISLGSSELETGHYSQIRFVLGDNNTITVDGETYALQTPSGQQSGVKLNLDADVEENTTYTLLVDFDAALSVVQQGNGDYLLKPVLHVVDLSETGSISGNVQPTDFNTHVMAISNGDTLSTITNDDGDFKITTVAKGSYDVVFDPSSDQYSDSTQTDVQVEEGENKDLGTVQLESSSSL